MNPEDTGKNYDAIASWWLEQMKDSTYGLAALERALTFAGQFAEVDAVIGDVMRVAQETGSIHAATWPSCS